MQTDSPDSTRNYWLFLDTTAHSTPIQLTEHARKRRAKVDPVGLLIDSRDAEVSQTALEHIRQSGAKIRHVSRWFHAVSVEATSAQMQYLLRAVQLKSVDLVANLKRTPSPESLDADKLMLPSDATSVELNYGFSLTQNQVVGAKKLHQAGYSGKGILIAMLDSGFNTDHPAFDSTNIVATWDFIGNDADVTGSDCSSDPQDRHGTGTFAAAGSYAPGLLIGTAYGADYILARTEITCDGTEIKVEEDYWIAAAEWADSIGADIISSSLGYTVFQGDGDYTMSQLDGNTALITIAADIAASKNILVCNAAGNERGDASWPTIIFPADGDSVLAVGATNASGQIAFFSSPGPSADGRIKPDIVSMGQSVYTAAATGGYTLMSGTSLSTPLVAGAAALALESDSQMTAMQLLEQIRATGDRAENPNNDYGYGMMKAVDAANILRVILPDSVEVESGQAIEIGVQTDGRTDELPLLTAYDLPTGAQLVDHGDGTGNLLLDSSVWEGGRATIGIVASISNFADSGTLIIYSTAASYQPELRAFPNPFSEHLSITGGIADDRISAVTILNSAGERIWEKVNILSESTDTITVEWDGRNSAGQLVTPGVYLVCVITERETKVLKVMKVR
jgi:subtilisin family serine protease